MAVRKRLAVAANKRQTERRPSKGKTAARWRGPEGKAFVEIIEDIRYGEPGRNGKKMALPWKQVLKQLHEQGYCFHLDVAKLKADYKSAKDYWETVYSGAPFRTAFSPKV